MFINSISWDTAPLFSISSFHAQGQKEGIFGHHSVIFSYWLLIFFFPRNDQQIFMGAAESSNWLLTPRLARAWFTQAGAGRPELILPFLRPSWLSRSADGMNSGLAEPTCAGMLHKSLVTSLGLIPLTPSTQKTSCRKPAGCRGSLCQQPRVGQLNWKFLAPDDGVMSVPLKMSSFSII